LVIAVDLLAQGTVRFDSIVPRATDTLAFVSLSATLVPSTVENAFSGPRGDLPVNLSGSINGLYIWSTGWHTWVANQSHVVLQHRIIGLDATMMLTVEAQSRIRP